MFGEFKDAKNTQNTNEDERATTSSTLAVSLRLLDPQDDEVRNDRHQVDHIHDVLKELRLRRARHNTQKEFDGEPDDADGLDEEERIAIVGRFVVREAAVGRHIDAMGALECRKCLGAEVGDGDEDADHGHDGEDASR